MPDINGVISPKPLATEWRGDLLQGVRVIQGTWADGSPLVAIPHYARNNRLGEEAQRRSAEVAGGDGNVNYAPGSPATTTSNAAPTNSAATRPGQVRGRFGESSSQVWIKEGTPAVRSSP